MSDDTRRLNFLASYEAQVRWGGSGGEACAVWVPDDDCTERFLPAEGYPLKFYRSFREAIDAAMKHLRVIP